LAKGSLNVGKQIMSVLYVSVNFNTPPGGGTTIPTGSAASMILTLGGGYTFTTGSGSSTITITAPSQVAGTPNMSADINMF
jgi:hypothetical protein